MSMDRQRVVNLDRQHIWRPYTSTDDHQQMDPLVIHKAEGIWLWDLDGRKYIDANGSWWCNTLGHNHPRIQHAIARQSQKLIHCSLAGTTHPEASLLAKELIEVAPSGMQRVFFSDDGSTAVEVAVRMSVQYWHQNDRPKRTRFLALSQAFHGDTLGASSVGDVGEFQRGIGELLFDVYRAPEPTQGAQGWQRVVENMLKTIDLYRDEIAGVIVEPLIQGAAGMRIWPAELLKQLRDATRTADTFLITDEVFTGYGRTGKMWACDHAEITPDILCTAKAFSAGAFPMAATITTERVFEGFSGDKTRALMYGHTFCGNPLGAAVAREVLAIYRDEGVIEQVRQKAAVIATAFEELQNIPGVVRTRALGMVAAADLGQGGYLGSKGWQVHQKARAAGIYLRPLGDTIYITPPFTIADEELSLLLQGVSEAVAATE